jgi:hypothetical protein
VSVTTGGRFVGAEVVEDEVVGTGAEVVLVVAVVFGGDIGPGPVDGSLQLERSNERKIPALALMMFSSDAPILGHASRRC